MATTRAKTMRNFMTAAVLWKYSGEGKEVSDKKTDEVKLMLIAEKICSFYTDSIFQQI